MALPCPINMVNKMPGPELTPPLPVPLGARCQLRFLQPPPDPGPWAQASGAPRGKAASWTVHRDPHTKGVCLHPQVGGGRGACVSPASPQGWLWRVPQGGRPRGAPGAGAPALPGPGQGSPQASGAGAGAWPWAPLCGPSLFSLSKILMFLIWIIIIISKLVYFLVLNILCPKT